MSDLATLIKNAQEEALKALKTQQEQVLAVHEELATTARKYWDSASFGGADRPDVRELVGDYVDFNQSLLGANREFIQNVLEIWNPRTS